MTGYLITYRPDCVNHCPGCGRSQWYVGRVSAECGFCATAIPLQDAVLAPTRPKPEIIRRAAA